MAVGIRLVGKLQVTGAFDPASMCRGGERPGLGRQRGDRVGSQKARELTRARLGELGSAPFDECAPFGSVERVERVPASVDERLGRERRARAECTVARMGELWATRVGERFVGDGPEAASVNMLDARRDPSNPYFVSRS